MSDIKKDVVGKLVGKVYEDVLSESAKAVGTSLGKAVRTSLRPVDGLFWTIDQAFGWVSETLTRKFTYEKRTELDIHPPPLEVTIRTLSALQTIGPLPNPMLRNMFANILASGMLGDDAVHPSFVETLRQLVSDECKLLSVVAWDTETPYSVVTTMEWGERPPAYRKGVYYPLAKKIFNSETILINAADNLKRLGIVEEKRHEIDDPQNSPSKEVASIAHTYFAELEPKGEMKLIIDVLRQTQWGNRFIYFCGAREFYTPYDGFKMPEWCE